VAGPAPVAAALTVSGSVTDAFNEPLTPLMVMLLTPGAAVLPAASVSVLLDVVVAGLKVAVTPAGTPLADSATPPLNPPAGETVTTGWMLPPCATDCVPGFKARLKLGCGATVVLLIVNAMDVVALKAPLVPLIVTVLVPTLAPLLAVSVRVVGHSP
jgi:hypothetical protein